METLLSARSLLYGILSLKWNILLIVSILPGSCHSNAGTRGSGTAYSCEGDEARLHWDIIPINISSIRISYVTDKSTHARVTLVDIDNNHIKNDKRITFTSNGMLSFHLRNVTMYDARVYELDVFFNTTYTSDKTKLVVVAASDCPNREFYHNPRVKILDKITTKDIAEGNIVLKENDCTDGEWECIYVGIVIPASKPYVICAVTVNASALRFCHGLHHNNSYCVVGLPKAIVGEGYVNFTYLAYKPSSKKIQMERSETSKAAVQATTANNANEAVVNSTDASLARKCTEECSTRQSAITAGICLLAICLVASLFVNGFMFYRRFSNKSQKVFRKERTNKLIKSEAEAETTDMPLATECV